MVKAENQLADWLSTMKREISRRNFNLPQYSLQARVQEFAKGSQGKFELWGKWKGRNTDVPESRLYSADSGAPEKSAEPAAHEGTEAADIEYLGSICRNLERAVTEPVKTWPKDDQNKNRKAYKVTGGHLIGESKAVATTLNGLGGPVIKTIRQECQCHLGLHRRGISDPKTDTWGPLKLAEVDILERNSPVIDVSVQLSRVERLSVCHTYNATTRAPEPHEVPKRIHIRYENKKWCSHQVPEASQSMAKRVERILWQN